MKKNILYLFAISFLFTSISCSNKKTDVTPASNADGDYSSAIQLKVGNFWIYDITSTSLISNTSTAEPFDSTYIATDTTVNGNVFSMEENPYGLKVLFRDSSGYIIDERGGVSFSASNFTDTLYRNLDGVRGFMINKDSSVTVPAGTFKTICFVTIEKGKSDISIPDNPTIFNKDFIVLTKTWYARNAGIVKQVLYGYDIAYTKELRRYKVTQ